MAHPVTWFQIQGPDAARLQAFYREAFAWRMSPSPDGTMTMVDAEAAGIAGGIGQSMNGAPSVTVYIDCGDIDAQLELVTAAGGHVAMPRMELPAGMGYIAGFTDPAGNWVGLWQAGKAPPPRAPAAKVKAKAPAAKAKVKAKAPAAKAKAKAKAPAAKAKAKAPAAKKKAKRSAPARRPR